MTGDLMDVVVVGGGAAGLSGALMLARARRSVVVVDVGEPRNAPAEGVHGLLGHDGVPPAQLLDRGRAEVRRYGGQVLDAEVASVSREGADFVVVLTDGRSLRARRLLVATGLVDELPDVPGLRERWGREVLHCPYCHGWEVRDRRIGVLAAGPRSVHQALLFRQWSADLTFFAGQVSLTGEQREQLVARGVRVVDAEVSAAVVEADRLTGLRLRGGEVVELDAVAVAPRARPRAAFLAGLGLRPVEHPSGMGEHIPADPLGRTEVPGLWVAGNVSDLAAQVGAAGAAGATAGAHINADLVEEETARAVAAARDGGRGRG